MFSFATFCGQKDIWTSVPWLYIALIRSEDYESERTCMWTALLDYLVLCYLAIAVQIDRLVFLHKDNEI